MTKKLAEKRGFLLILAALVMVIVAVLAAVYMSSIVVEKRSVDDERGVFQAVNLAEGGANKAYSAMRTNIQTNMLAFDALNKNQQDTQLANYAVNSLLLFNSTGVTINATAAQINLNSTVASEFNSPLTGYVNAVATIFPAASVVNDDDVYHFNNYTYSVAADAVVTEGGRTLRKRVVFPPATFSATARRTTFAKFALFTFHHKTSANGSTVWFTNNTNFFGPVHTNDQLSFANNPSGHFTNEVTQHQGTARFYNNGTSILLDDDHNAGIDVPVFDAGFTRGADTIPLPSAVTQTDLRNAAIGTMSVPGTSNLGVFVPNSGGACTGGIYLNGSTGDSTDNPSIEMTVDSSNNPVYTFTRDVTTTSHHHTTTTTYTSTVTVNYAANTTTFVDEAGVSHTYTGKPDGNTHEGIIIYANDDIKSLKGTVQQDTALTVSGERNITITDNVMYQGYSTTPMLNAQGYDNMLGILSWGGNVVVDVPDSAHNDISIHGVVMAPHGVFTVDGYNSGPNRGTATLLGGVISDYYGAFGTFSSDGTRTGYGRNFIYDARVLAGQAPPYFPYMDKYAFDEIPTLTQRPIWKEEESLNE
jgi:hypothetical protein